MGSEVSIGIIGSGPAGCTAAYSIKRSLDAAAMPHRITILEASDHHGGKIRTERSEFGIFERGAEALVLKDRTVIDLIEELGITSLPPSHLPFGLLSGTVLNPVDPKMLRSFPRNVLPLLRSPLFSFKGKTRAIAGIFGRRFAEEQRHQDMPLGKSLEKWLGNEVAEVFGACLGNIYGGDAQDLSTAIYYPSLLGNLDHKTGGAIVSFEDGMISLLDLLLNKSGATLELRQEASAIRLVKSGWEVSLRSGSTRVFDVLAVTPPGRGSTELLGSLHPLMAMWGGIIEITSGATVVFVLPQCDLPDLTGYLIPSREGRTATGVTFVSKKWRAERSSHTILRVFLKGDAAMRDPEREARQEVERTLGITASPISTWVDLWHDSFIRFPVLSGEGGKKVFRKLSRIPGLFVPQSAIIGTGMSDAVRHSLSIGNEVREYLRIRAEQYRDPGSSIFMENDYGS